MKGNFIFFKIDIYVKIYMCVCACMSGRAQGFHEKLTETLELETSLFMGCWNPNFSSLQEQSSFLAILQTVTVCLSPSASVPVQVETILQCKKCTFSDRVCILFLIAIDF